MSGVWRFIGLEGLIDLQVEALFFETGAEILKGISLWSCADEAKLFCSFLAVIGSKEIYRSIYLAYELLTGIINIQIFNVLYFMRILFKPHDWSFQWSILYIINGEYSPGAFFKDNSRTKNKGSQIFRRKLKGSQINFKVWPNFFKISIFLEDTVIQTFEGLIYCSETPASTSPFNNYREVWLVMGLNIFFVK